MWEELKELLGEMIEDENLSFSLTPDEQASELLMIVVRRKTYENVLNLMAQIEVRRSALLDILRHRNRRNRQTKEVHHVHS